MNVTFLACWRKGANISNSSKLINCVLSEIIGNVGSNSLDG